MKRKGMRKGEVNDRRRFGLFLSNEEKRFVERLLGKIRYPKNSLYRATDGYDDKGKLNRDGDCYLWRRKQSRHIPIHRVFQVLQKGYIVEVHNNIPDDVRVVLRHDNAKFGTSVVVSLKTGRIVTMYENPSWDRHYGDSGLYKWEEDLTVAIPRILKMEVSA